MPLRLLLVDDNAHFLQAARCLLQREGLAVVGVASTSVDALRLADELRPDVALVDVELGEESGFELASRLVATAETEPPLVILISAYPKEDLPDLVGTGPAAGFLPKSGLSRKAIVELLGEEEPRGRVT
jgi:CheY-like chemotaxis protein